MAKHTWKFRRNSKGELPFIKTAKAILFTLSPIDLKVYCVLLAHRNQNGLCFPSIPTIADEADLDDKTVKASRKRLRDLGLIKWVVNKREKNSCLYEFPLLSGTNAEQDSILANLKSDHETVLRKRRLMREGRKATGRTVGRGTKRTVGRTTRRTANKNKEKEKTKEKCSDAPSARHFVGDGAGALERGVRSKWIRELGREPTEEEAAKIRRLIETGKLSTSTQVLNAIGASRTVKEPEWMT